MARGEGEAVGKAAEILFKNLHRGGGHNEVAVAVSLFCYQVGELALDRGDHDLVTGNQLVDLPEWGAISGSVPRDSRIPSLSGQW